VADDGLLADGELRLVVAPDGHLEPAEPLAATIDPPAEPRRAPEAEVLPAGDAALIAANRRRISELHEQRYGGITSFGDLFASSGRGVIAVFGVAAVIRIAIFGRVLPLAAGLALLAAALVLVCFTLRDQTRRKRHERSRPSGAKSGGSRSRRGHSFLGSVRPLRRMSRALDAVIVDDTELEDDLEPLYEHGNKMDNGFWGVGR
jgi:hypothetical protein